GHARYPVALVEVAFHLAFVAIACILHRRGLLRGQLFHVYLISYGVFRFIHEFFRDTPRPWGGVSTYQVLAIVVVLFGVWRFRVRAGAERALCLEACDALSLTDQSALVNFPKTPESPP